MEIDFSNFMTCFVVFLGNMGEIWTAQVLGKMTWKQPFEIVASLNYDGTIAGLSKAKLDLKTSMLTNFLFDLDLSTSHPKLQHFKMIFKEEPIGRFVHFIK